MIKYFHELGEIRKGKEIGYKRNNKYIWHACKMCGKERWVQICGGLPTRRICKDCRAKLVGEKQTHLKHANWKGGCIKTGVGYILIKLQPDDFFYPMVNKQGYVREHRLVVAKALGRCLLSWETVHHKEGYAKDDNRYPETLELLPTPYKHDALTRMIKHIRKLEREIEILKRDACGVDND